MLIDFQQHYTPPELLKGDAGKVTVDLDSDGNPHYLLNPLLAKHTQPPFDAIAGRAEIISFSTDGTALWYNPLSWFGALRSGRAGTNLRPAHAESAK